METLIYLDRHLNRDFTIPNWVKETSYVSFLHVNLWSFKLNHVENYCFRVEFSGEYFTYKLRNIYVQQYYIFYPQIIWKTKVLSIFKANYLEIIQKVKIPYSDAIIIMNPPGELAENKHSPNCLYGWFWIIHSHLTSRFL